MRTSLILLLTGLALLAAGCGGAGDSDGSSAPAEAATNRQVFAVQGVVVALDLGHREVKIQHEAIPGYMPAMTMFFDVKDTNELAGIAAGDKIAFRLTVTATEGWIDQVRRTGGQVLPPPPTNGPFRMVRAVEPLALGERMQECRLTNQLGQAFTTRQWEGRVLAISFLFTRCPYPAFCPWTAHILAEAQDKLKGGTNAPPNWHLLTVSFDPEFDTPAVLQNYANAYHADPARWTFATGSLMEVTALGDQFGLQFWRDENGGLSHNMRTAVIDGSGRLRRVFEGNQWTSDELVAEMKKASQERSLVRP